jgi:hypothetical protein
MKVLRVFCAALALACTAWSAHADSTAAIKAECAKQLKLPPAGCACIATKADEELSEAQQFLLIATVTENTADRPEGLRELTPEEVEEVFGFLGSAPSACAGATQTKPTG